MTRKLNRICALLLALAMALSCCAAFAEETNENPVLALKRELQTLTVEEYMQTVKDLLYPKKSEMREFGKVYDGKGDVYVKIRVELLSAYGNHTAFVMSFHYAEIAFTPDLFPYRKKRGDENP